MKKILFITLIFLVALNTACSTATAPSGNSNSASNSNSNTAANIPPEFSTSPVVPSGNSTPGIPDPKVLKEQMNKTLSNKNIVNELPKNQKDLEKRVDDTLKTVRKPN